MQRLHRNHLLHGHRFRSFHVVAYPSHHGAQRSAATLGASKFSLNGLRHDQQLWPQWLQCFCVVLNGIALQPMLRFFAMSSKFFGCGWIGLSHGLSTLLDIATASEVLDFILV